MTNLDSVLKSRYITLLTKVHPYSQSYGFSNSDVRMWELDHKEGWAPKNWCFQIVMLEKALESSLDCNEIKQASLKENQSWIVIERTDGEAEAPKFWLPNGKSQLIGKDPDAGEDRGQKRREEGREWDGWMTSLTQLTWIWGTLGDSEGQGSLVCCSLWGHKESDTS